METSKGVDEIKKILNLLDEDELIRLAMTTTQNLVRQELIKDKNDAIDIIIRHSADLETILNRKVIRREYLFQYLHEKGIKIATPVTKGYLITKVLDLWREKVKTGDRHERRSQEKRKDEKELSNRESVNRGMANQEIANRESTNHDSVSKTPVTSVQTQVNDVNLLATKFCEWFYTILNGDQPIGTEHFWNDCSLKLNLVSDSANLSNHVENDAEELTKLLFSTKSEHGLFFNPNISSEGVRGKMNNHGLVLVFACGTLHTKDCCVGIFEQMFILARDPFSDNNWKIKHTQLNLRSQPSVSSTPRLEDSTMRVEIYDES